MNEKPTLCFMVHRIRYDTVVWGRVGMWRHAVRTGVSVIVACVLSSTACCDWLRIQYLASNCFISGLGDPTVYPANTVYKPSRSKYTNLRLPLNILPLCTVSITSGMP